MTPPQSSSSHVDDAQQREFSFVAHHQHGSRSHAMREHWKQRRHKMNMEKRSREERHHRAILPTPSTSEATESQAPNASAVSSEHGGSASSDHPMLNWEMMPTDELASMVDGIPAQALSGMNLALGSSRLDPFDRFPVTLTGQHHKLLHHWLSTYAMMMFGDIHVPNFNPMRDVWFPLDLSNAASFNAIMAHSAAHLARMQGCRRSNEALKFKAEAVRTVTLWMNDPDLALGDDVLAAVLRLLTYERYWGTEAEWRVHHNGLLNLIEARGGITALSSNWRLELTTFLVSLMAKPSWFDCSNQIWEISRQPSPGHPHPILRNIGDLHRIRCLWLLSFVQDMGTFRSNSPGIYSHGLVQYAALQDALVLLKLHLRHHEGAATHRGDVCDDDEFARLACLFFICVLLQLAMSASTSTPDHDGDAASSTLGLVASLNDYLDENRPMWQESIENLYSTLFHNFILGRQGLFNTDYVLNMTHVMASMSGEVRYGVERCLLNTLCHTENNGFDAFEEEWTPDFLLSLIHGQ